MNKLLIALALMIGISASIEAVEACVTYNPATNTYTVDPSGSVRHGKNTHSKKPKKVKK